MEIKTVTKKGYKAEQCTALMVALRRLELEELEFQASQKVHSETMSKATKQEQKTKMVGEEGSKELERGGQGKERGRRGSGGRKKKT